MKPGRSGTQLISLPVLVMAVSTVVLSGCASHAQYDVRDNTRASEKESRSKNKGQQQAMRSSTEPDNDWGDAVTAPLEDLNLKRTQIPTILADAVSKPYDLAGMDRCEAIAAEVRELDSLLGDDFDEPPPPPDNSTMREKGGKMANNAAVGAVRGATRSIIPFRGLVRQMTGADKHQKAMDTAIQAGKVRRAYLKGVGMNKNCAPPAAPSWFQPRVYVDTYVDENGAPPKKKKTSRKHR